MTKRTFRAFLAMGALAAASASWGCVADRPSRNGVFNENQYLRKDFIIRNGDGSTQDTGWMMKATIVAASQPNPIAFAAFPGAENGGQLVRFEVTQDHLNLINLREISPTDDAIGNRVPEVVNAWPVTNVDLKYQINLDGEKTNFYQENQELDWQVRQWVKINFAKNDLSDVAPFGEYMTYFMNKCTDLGNSTVQLVTDSFKVDEPNDYMQWTVRVTAPVNSTDADCNAQMDPAVKREFDALGRANVTFDIMYSFVRATPPEKITYKPLVLDEKDPIQRKYGYFINRTIARDTATGLLASRQQVIRHDPQKPIVWYFAKGYPEAYKHVFVSHGGVVDQTNKIFEDAGVPTRLVFLNYDDATTYGDHAGPQREYGDVRYSFVRFETDLDTGSPFAGVTQFVVDPRTGEALTSSIVIAGFSVRAYYAERIDAYLQSIGATYGVDSGTEWPDGPEPCLDGDTMPIDPAVTTANHNSNSTLYYEMQKAMNMPAEQYGALGPANFIAQQDDDFRRAYFALLPYIIFKDPLANPYVTPEGGDGVYGAPGQAAMFTKDTQFQTMMAQIDRGMDPFDGVTGPQGIQQATTFANTMRTLQLNHNQLATAKSYQYLRERRAFDDQPPPLSMLAVMGDKARRCNGVKNADGSVTTHWETKQEWIDNMVDSYWSQTVVHEFGHSMGLRHNFMASVDQPNFAHYKDLAGRDHVGLYANSIMEYNSMPDRVFYATGNDENGNVIQGWAPYDRAAIAWAYSNDAPVAPPDGAVAQGISGQVSATAPWKDPYGFTADGKEIQYLFCTDEDATYTPLCRTGDLGSTPSEIISNALDNYEWAYKYRNFRQYFKYWDDAQYGNAPAGLVQEMRKFISLWAFDWSASELTDTFRRIGITNPDPNGSAAQYYDQLTNKFTKELSAANQMVAAFHQAVIQQSAGERPYRTIFDKYFGDVTQQGIILDKYFAMSGWVGLWPTTNYDQNQAGFYIASYGGLGERSYDDIAQVAVNNMVGGGYDVYPWFVPTAVALFAQDTHSPSFAGRIDVRDWIGGKVFNRLDDFLHFFQDLASQNNYVAWTTQTDTPVAASANGAAVTLTVPNTTQINVGDHVLVDAGDQQEETMVLALTAQSITVTLTEAHTGTYPITAQPCTEASSCNYDPRVLAATSGQLPGEFLGPDHKRWIWAYIPDRNQWIAAERERNTATYIIVHNYNLDIMTSQDDGAFPGNAYGLQLPMKYTLDAFNTYN